MSGLHLYCLAPEGVVPPNALRGVDEAPVRVESVGAFSVWVSAHDVRPEPTLDGVRRHHDVVRAAATGCTPLPVRFGEWVLGGAALSALVEDRRMAIGAALEAVRGGVEYGVHVAEAGKAEESDRTEAEASPVTPGAGPGRAYLGALARAYASRDRRAGRKEAVTEALRRQVGAFVRQERVGRVRAPGLLSTAHLVGRDEEAAYRLALQEFGRRNPALEVHVLGPWPPYSFAS